MLVAAASIFIFSNQSKKSFKASLNSWTRSKRSNEASSNYENIITSMTCSKDKNQVGTPDNIDKLSSYHMMIWYDQFRYSTCNVQLARRLCPECDKVFADYRLDLFLRSPSLSTWVFCQDCTQDSVASYFDKFDDVFFATWSLPSRRQNLLLESST